MHVCFSQSDAKKIMSSELGFNVATAQYILNSLLYVDCILLQKKLVIGYLIAHVIYWVMHFQIIRPHHSTTYVDAAYCYRPSSVACWSVYHSYEPRKTAEPIEMPFGLWARLDSTNHVLDAVQIPAWKGAIFRGKGRPIIKYRDLPAWAVQKRLNWSRCCLGCWVSWTLQTTY